MHAVPPTTHRTCTKGESSFYLRLHVAMADVGEAAAVFRIHRDVLWLAGHDEFQQLGVK
jgi:hypothetical protein